MLPEGIDYRLNEFKCISREHTIKLKKVLKFKQSEKRGVAVFKGIRDDGLIVVVKWHKSKKSGIIEEEQAYSNIVKHGGSTIRIMKGYTLEGPQGFSTKVLVMDYHKPLHNPNICRLARDILRQLEYIHRFCVHSGIKPDNILMKGRSYILIDMGSISSVRHSEGGYIRTSWSPKWTCQERRIEGQRTLPIHDFLELATTLRSFNPSSKERKKIKKFVKAVNYGKSISKLRRIFK